MVGIFLRENIPVIFFVSSWLWMFAHNIDLYSKDTGNSYEAPIYSMKVCGIFGEIDV